jgi:hypothetical protein
MPVLILGSGILVGCSTRNPGRRAMSEETGGTEAVEREQTSLSTQDCLAFLEDLRAKQESSAFFGFGEGSTSEDAVGLATADLVRQIQTRVSSSGVTAESNREVVFSSLTQSSVDALVTGMDIKKRCRQGFRWQAVTMLEKPVFFRNIQLRVQPVIRDAQELTRALESTDVSAGELLSTATRARAMSRGDAGQARDILSVCRTLGSCATMDDSVFARLESASARIFARYAFVLRPKDEEATSVAGVVSRLMSEEGFAVSAAHDTNNQAALSCQRKDFPPMANTGYMVTEILCGVTFSVGTGGPVAGLTRTYRGNGLGESRQEALSEARRKLAPKDPGISWKTRRSIRENGNG